MGKYDFDALVIGGGSAGLTTAGIAANFGLKTMMVEEDRLGGDCTWTGCIPSKTLLKAASVYHHSKNCEPFGLQSCTEEADPRNVMFHVDKVRREVYREADDPKIFEKMGIEVVSGNASFLDDHTIILTDGNGMNRKVSGRYIFICTGAKPVIPEIDGINTIDYLTSESLFEIDGLPKSLIIVGAGPVGTEMSQAFCRLGTQVHVVDMAPGILNNDGPEITEILKSKLIEEGVNFHLNADIQKISNTEDGIIISIHQGGKKRSVAAEKILFAAGRRANIESLKPDAAGLQYSKQGITVNDRCRTNKRHIYAAGDVTGRYQLTHMSEHMAKVATSNAILKIPMKIDIKHVPRVTYTEPELGHIGATEQKLKDEGKKFEVYRFPYSKIDRAITDGQTTGLIKVYAKKWSGKILGASVVGAHAGELISHFALAMRNGISLRKFADTIHPYPGYSLGARRAADQWYIRNQSEAMVKWIKRIFGYRGKIPDFSDKTRIM